jgi:hypothetical protein
MTLASGSSTSRAAPYAISLLTAVVLTLIPSVLWFDLVLRYPFWPPCDPKLEALVHRAPPPPHIVRELARELAVFKVLVAPTVMPTWFGVSRPIYTRIAFADGVWPDLVGATGLRLAAQYFAVAFPTWLVILLVLFELGRLLPLRGERSVRA